MNHIFWNMLANIRNGLIAKKPFILQKKNIYIINILSLLWDENFIQGYVVCKNSNNLKIFLNYRTGGLPTTKKITVITRPSKTHYFTLKQIWKINSNSGLCLFSTTKGILTLVECKKKNIGGILVCVLN